MGVSVMLRAGFMIAVGASKCGRGLFLPKPACHGITPLLPYSIQMMDQHSTQVHDRRRSRVEICSGDDGVPPSFLCSWRTTRATQCAASCTCPCASSSLCPTSLAAPVPCCLSRATTRRCVFVAALVVCLLSMITSYVEGGSRLLKMSTARLGTAPGRTASHPWLCLQHCHGFTGDCAHTLHSPHHA